MRVWKERSEVMAVISQALSRGRLSENLNSAKYSPAGDRKIEKNLLI